MLYILEVLIFSLLLNTEEMLNIGISENNGRSGRLNYLTQSRQIFQNKFEEKNFIVKRTFCFLHSKILIVLVKVGVTSVTCPVFKSLTIQDVMCYCK